MVRPTLQGLPAASLPHGFGIRRFRTGDEANWTAILVAADQLNPINSGLFRRQFGSDDRLLEERQFYLVAPSGEAIGTATAWFDEHFEGGGWGRVHWVAIVPGWQGRGLSRPLLRAVCERLAELGHVRAFLRTEAGRPAALRLYRSFGFQPFIRQASEAETWKHLGAPVESFIRAHGVRQLG